MKKVKGVGKLKKKKGDRDCYHRQQNFGYVLGDKALLHLNIQKGI